MEGNNSQKIDLPSYRDSLQHLPNTPASSLHALEIFHNCFDKRYPVQNDKAFKAYLEYQVILIDTLNNQLLKRPDYEKISSLIWSDTSLHEPEGLAYANQLNRYGMVLKSTEGIIYIGRSTKPIRAFFYNHLSPATQEFYDQFEIETNQELAEDGMLLITQIELADRLAFWDSLLAKHPNHLFAQFAKNNIDDYLQYLLEGMDNTPAFDFETKKLYPEFLEAYEYFKHTYPTLNSTAVIEEYMILLKSQDYKRTEAVTRFINQYPS